MPRDHAREKRNRQFRQCEPYEFTIPRQIEWLEAWPAPAPPQALPRRNAGHDSKSGAADLDAFDAGDDREGALFFDAEDDLGGDLGALIGPGWNARRPADLDLALH